MECIGRRKVKHTTYNVALVPHKDQRGLRTTVRLTKPQTLLTVYKKVLSDANYYLQICGILPDQL